MPSPTEITVSQLSRLIGTPDAPVLIDLRIDEDFNDDPRLLPCARRHSFSTISNLAPELIDQSVVVYCQKGKKISQGAMALLRGLGVRAETLEGGQFAWRDKGGLLIPAAKLPMRIDAQDECQGSLWVTRHRPKIDRIACPWLIRRFIDPRARFLFVSPSEVTMVAEKFNAEPFDVEGAFWNHRGNHCTFDTMIEEFELESGPLKKLATIIRGADLGEHDLAPQSAGLVAASLGLSRMYRDDWQQLEASMVLYDGLYRWCRDATEEVHDWSVHSGQLSSTMEAKREINQ